MSLVELGTVTVNGIILKVKGRIDKRANSLKLRLDPTRSFIVITMNRQNLAPKAHVFLKQCQVWLENKVKPDAVSIVFEEGAIIPIFGKSYKIVHQLSSRSRVSLIEDEIVVSGAKETISDITKRWLHRHARSVFEEQSHICAATIGATVNRISVRDTKARWGSCSPNGNLSYSWRLIFAPSSVSRYVCCHEVAHLLEMNHSPKFWKVVEGLCPDYKKQRQWLRANSSTLFRYG